MLESCIAVELCESKHSHLKAKTNNKGSLLIPAPLGIHGHSFTHFWMCSRLWTDRVAKFFCQMGWKQNNLTIQYKHIAGAFQNCHKGISEWSEHQGNRQTDSWGSRPLEKGHQSEWHSTLWMFHGREGGSFILNQYQRFSCLKIRHNVPLKTYCKGKSH